MIEQKPIINLVSILRKNGLSDLYRLPTFDDLITNASIKPKHLDKELLLSWLSTIYEQKSDHDEDITRLQNLIPELSDIYTIENGELLIGGLTFIPKSNVLALIDAIQPGISLETLTDALASYVLATTYNTLATDVTNLTNSQSSLANNLSTLENAFNAHVHKLEELTNVSLSSDWLTITIGEEGAEIERYIKLLETQTTLEFLRTQASPTAYGNTYASFITNNKAVLIAEPKLGYEFLRWTLNNTPISSNAIHIVNNPSTSSIYVGEFIIKSSEDPTDPTDPTEPTTYTLTIGSAEHGSVLLTVGGEEVTSPYEGVEGTTVHVEVIPETGYAFNGWDNSSYTEAEFDLTLDTTITLTPSFIKVYRYMVKALPNSSDNALKNYIEAYYEANNIDASLNTEITITTGTLFTLLVPNLDLAPNITQGQDHCGYSFLKWTNDQYNTGNTINESTARTWSGTAGNTLMGSPVIHPEYLTTFFANYRKTWALDAAPRCGNTILSGEVAASIKNGDSLGPGTSFVIPDGSTVILTAPTINGYTFSKWSNNETRLSIEVLISLNSSVYPIYVLNSTTYTVELSADPSAGGTVSGGGTFNENSSVTVIATPNSAYNFTGWTKNGTQVSTDTSYTFTLTSNISLVAVFTKKTYTITVDASPAEGGTVSASQTTVEYDGSVTLTANPNTGYEFDCWKEGSVILNSTTISNITSNRTFTAYFNLVTPQVNHIKYYTSDVENDIVPGNRTLTETDLAQEINVSSALTFVILVPQDITLHAITALQPAITDVTDSFTQDNNPVTIGNITYTKYYLVTEPDIFGIYPYINNVYTLS